MNNDRIKFFVQNFGGQYGGAGMSSTLQRQVQPDTTLAPKVAQPNLFEKLGSVISQSAHIGVGAAEAAARYVGNTAVDIGKSALNTGRTLVDLQVQPAQLQFANKSIDALNNAQDALDKAYRAGKVTKKDYADKMNGIQSARQDINDKFLKPISEGPTAKQRADDIVETTVNLLTVGRFSAIKSASEDVAKTAINKVLDTAATKIQDSLLRVPAAKELVARNTALIAKQEAQQLAGETLEQYMSREGRRVAAGLLIKRPLFYQQNIQDASNIYHDMIQGKYGDAIKTTGWVATQMLGGGPIGWFLNKGSAAGVKLRELSRGRGSFIDKLSAEIGDKNPAQIGRYITKLQEKAPNEFKRTEDTYRIMQSTNLHVADDNVDRAVQNVLQTYDQAGIPREQINPKTFVDDYSKWYEAAQITDGLKGRRINGLEPDQVNNLVVVRWDSVMKRGLADAIKEAGDDRQAMAGVLSDFSSRTTNGWGNNPNLMKQLTRIIDKSGSAEEAAKKIKSIPTATVIPDGIPKTVQKKLADLGYGVAVPLGGVRKTPIVKLEDTKKLVTGAIKGRTDIFDVSTEPSPTLSSIAGALDKAGLSPQAQNQVANDALRQSLVASLAVTDIGRSMGVGSIDADATKGGAAILSQLQRYVENKKPVSRLAGKISSGKSAITDIRMLRVNEIGEALGVSEAEAKTIQKAVINAYTQVPLEFRGLGDRAIDLAYKYNPAQKYYARIQSALRYTYNPFFRAQEQVETAILSKMNANKFLWMQPKEKLDEAVTKLTKSGFFDGNMMSAAADDNIFGRISANMTKFQKRNLAGLAQTIAERKGLDIDTMIRDFPDELDDALRVVVQYPNKGVLASSMARTLNVAFFPMRYNTKVTLLAAKKLAEMPPSIQLGVIQGFSKMTEWLKSDEGIRWQSDNADAIQVFKWITPIGSIQQFYKVATGNVEAPGDLGMLGGLPFGLITQILDSQGIINLNTPYIDPKTGSQFPDYIPVTTRAKAAVATNDLLGALFSFPGRTLGLPGKEQTLRKMVGAFIDTNGQDFEKRYDTENLTPLQKNMIRVLKGDTSNEAVDSLYTSPAPGQFNYYTIPSFAIPQRSAVPQQTNVLTRAEVAAQKQAQRKARSVPKVARPIAPPAPQ